MTERLSDKNSLFDGKKGLMKQALRVKAKETARCDGYGKGTPRYGGWVRGGVRGNG
jgi:hypothetical protein